MNMENERLSLKMLPFIDFTKYCSPRVDVDSKILIRFDNLTRSSIMLFWHSFNGDIKKYSTMPPGHGLVMSTFVGHIWSFADEVTGDHLIDDNNNYYLTIQRNSNDPGSSNNENNCQIVKIKTPLLNLQEICYKVIRDELVFNNNVAVYEQLNLLPRNVIDELKIILLKGFHSRRRRRQSV
ncbi:von Hippel-Lindau disease tumor suppressor [Diaphorina citri]|uniref:von Hippel-Lindau disease tumor suppressor n=1 Tax=Diaphorina citri TaxID=121845 RepID=A0A1S4EKX2_DIACI|nr:von Hippel-Lindau disease tumor suppressor [Diaphorina citri]